MKIGFDAKRAFRNNTGLGNYSRMVIGNYAANHPESSVVLFTPSIKGREGLFAEMGNVTVVTPHGLWRLAPWLWRTLGVGIRRSGVELFHGLSHELPLLIPHGVQTVVTMHDLIVWRFPKLFPFPDRVIYRMKQRSSCRRADAVVAVSQQTAQDVSDYILKSGNKIRVIDQSADSIFYKPVADEEVDEVRGLYNLPDRFVLCVGTVERRKNQASVVRAFEKLPSDVHLVIVGRATEYMDEVKTVCAQLGLEDRVHFHSDIAFKHFPAVYRAAQLSVYMSYFEGFGIPVLESLCCGTPVVASNRSSIPEVGGKAALYADPDNVDEIATQIIKLLDDGQLRSQLKRNAAEQVETFTAASVVEQLNKLYSTILSRR